MPRDELIISTKAGWRMWPGPYGDWGCTQVPDRELDQSLQRMGLDYVDIFYHHRPDPEDAGGGDHGRPDQPSCRQGKALYVGVSQLFGGAITRRRWKRPSAERPVSHHLIHQLRSTTMLVRRIEGRDLLPHTPRAGGTGVHRLRAAGLGPAHR